VIATRSLGTRGVTVTRLGLGCAPLGNLFDTVTDEDAAATVAAAWDAGIRYFDTAPLYGLGLSEERVGRALAGRPRDEYVLATKVGRLIEDVPGADPGIFAVAPGREATFDYSRDAVLRSIDASLGRLGLDRIDVVLVHDPDEHETAALDHAFPALLTLRDEGVIRAVGGGMNQAAMLQRFVERLDLDCVLLAGRWTLLDRSGGELLDVCAARGVGVILGGVFNSGLLADPDGATTYDYAPAPSDLRRRARALRDRAAAHGVGLTEAALAFGRRHPAVATTIVGARTAAEVRTDVTAWGRELPASLWPALDAAPRH
jgi:D-threo-aldose 1-dehydrogenase